MPLKRAQWGAPYEETKSVCFPMVDTDTGEQISCEISFELPSSRSRTSEGSAC